MKYYITQTGALFLEARSKKLINGKWLTSHEASLAKKPFGHGVPKTNRILRGGKWIPKPEEGSK